MFSLDFLLKGVAAPAGAACVVALLLRRICSGTRGIGAVAYAAGQLLGTAWMLSGSGEWLPSRNLQWVPWVGVAAAMIGPTVVATGLATIERWLLTFLASVAAAVVLVPQWPDLWPPRWLSVALFALAATVVARLLDGLIRRSSPRVIALLMASGSIVAAMLIAVSLSLSVAEAALTTSAALMGTAVAMSFRSDEQAVRGLCLPYTLAVGGWCYVSAIESPPPAPPLVGLLFLPAAPLVIWFTAVGPVSRCSTRRRLIVDVLLWMTTAAAISAWVWFGTEGGDEEYARLTRTWHTIT
ncbi:MAG TPA: hypothetical protein VM165_10640 [Planctomycetaceae bacterium]|nr:hypothetical protein [Planctomycetaceae bacterium]